LGHILCLVELPVACGAAELEHEQSARCTVEHWSWTPRLLPACLLDSWSTSTTEREARATAPVEKPSALDSTEQEQWPAGSRRAAERPSWSCCSALRAGRTGAEEPGAGLRDGRTAQADMRIAYSRGRRTRSGGCGCGCG
jgi:hypothetical protein